MYKLRTQHRIYGKHTLKDHKGKCSKPHGHQYEVILEIHKKELDDINMVYDTHDVNVIFKDFVGSDHLDLNEFMCEDNPTMEFMAEYFYSRLKRMIPELYSVTVFETPEASTIYVEDDLL